MQELEKAAQQALEALERGETKLRFDAITSLRAALEQPVAPAPVAQEPVATYMGHRETPAGTLEFWGIAEKRLERGTDLYTAPQPRQPLTDEQITEICKAVAKEGPEDSIDRFVRAIEAAHGIKG